MPNLQPLPKDLPLTRKQWQALREKNGLKQGAVKGVSLGAELDKWHKVYASGNLTLIDKAYRPLEAAINKYLAGQKYYSANNPKGLENDLFKLIQVPASDFAEWAIGLRAVIVTELKAWQPAVQSYRKSGAGNEFLIMSELRDALQKSSAGKVHKVYETAYVETKTFVAMCPKDNSGQLEKSGYLKKQQAVLASLEKTAGL